MAALFKDNEQVVALGVNCTAPQYVNALIENLRPATDKAIVVYPNSGEHFDPDTKCWQGHTDPFACAEAAVGWRERGASIIGGCCRMGPEHIAAMRGAFFPSKQPGSIPTE
jgi:homocysteine S-methyltransferase